MKRGTIRILLIGVAMALFSACASTPAPVQTPWRLNDLVTAAQTSVVTVAGIDIDGKATRLGSGFFIDKDGTLVTNYHVLDGAYTAAIKTAEGQRFDITTVLAQDATVDLIKVKVDIPPHKVSPLVLSQNDPQVADRVVVIGSPMGFEQTISEGIVSAVREHPTGGRVYQLTAPISQGSSGSPALNLNGDVIGVVTFQASEGQNLNFAVSASMLSQLPGEREALSVSEWTIRKSGRDIRLAASLCQKGTRLAIEGEYGAALAYYQRAAETNPGDPEAWHGLGSCYIGLNQPDDAIDAFNHSIDADPNSARAHFVLAVFYMSLEKYNQAIQPLERVINIDPDNVTARLQLADVYGKLDQPDAQLALFREILQIKPNHVPTLHRLGNAVGRMGRYDEALELLLRASALSPDSAEIHFDLGVTYHFKQQTDKELRAYTSAIAADPRMVLAHFNLGILFIELGNLKQALDQYEILKGLDTERAKQLFGKIYPAPTREIEGPE